jgi:hypothetical protein
MIIKVTAVIFDKKSQANFAFAFVVVECAFLRLMNQKIELNHKNALGVQRSKLF